MKKISAIQMKIALEAEIESFKNVTNGEYVYYLKKSNGIRTNSGGVPTTYRAKPFTFIKEIRALNPMTNRYCLFWEIEPMLEGIRKEENIKNLSDKALKILNNYLGVK